MAGYPSSSPFRLAEAQQPKKIPHIGLLGAGSPSSYSTRIPALREGLRDLGYIEGKNIVIEYRYAEGKLDRLPDLAVELVDLKVDIIHANSDYSVRAAKKATRTIPIIFTSVSDPVADGFVVSLAASTGERHGADDSISRVRWQKARTAQGGLP